VSINLAIFDKKARNFFSPKVFSRPLRHIEPKKIKKKLFPKSGWVSMDRPICINSRSRYKI